MPFEGPDSVLQLYPPATGEVPGSLQVQPERCVDQLLNVGPGRIDARQLSGPLGTSTVELGQISGREGRPQSPAESVPDRLHHLERHLAPSGILETPQVLGT